MASQRRKLGRDLRTSTHKPLVTPVQSNCNNKSI